MIYLSPDLISRIISVKCFNTNKLFFNNYFIIKIKIRYSDKNKFGILMNFLGLNKTIKFKYNYPIEYKSYFNAVAYLKNIPELNSVSFLICDSY
jgi:hypothetical protein